MPEFLRLLPPDEARALLLAGLPEAERPTEVIETSTSLGRVTAEAIRAPHALPEFPRSTVDGYAVRSRDTFGATDSLPAYLRMAGEIPMGRAAGMTIQAGQCALIHTGGMLPPGADAVVMVEHTQVARASQDEAGEVELMRAVAAGENTIAVGEELQAGET